MTTAPLLAHWSRAAVAVVGLAGLAIAATVVMWAHYGTAVFYEMVVAGFTACF